MYVALDPFLVLALGLAHSLRAEHHDCGFCTLCPSCTQCHGLQAERNALQFLHPMLTAAALLEMCLPPCFMLTADICAGGLISSGAGSWICPWPAGKPIRCQADPEVPRPQLANCSVQRLPLVRHAWGLQNSTETHNW